MTEMSPEVREIMSAYDRLPRELKNSFNSQKSRARKRLGIEDDAEESLAVLEAWLVFSKSEKYAEWQAAQSGETVPGIGKLLNLPERSGASAGDPMTITDAEALEETSRASGAAGFSRGSTPEARAEEPAPAESLETAATIPASEPVKASMVAHRSLRQKAQGWLDALISVHSARYGLIKLVCYAALIPASSQSVLAFFNGLNLYGDHSTNRAFAFLLTAAVDYLAIDTFTRGFQEARRDWRQFWRVWFLILASLAVIGGNVYLAHWNMRNDANIESTDTAMSEWKARVSAKEKAQAEAQLELAKATGAYLSVKWPGNADPAGCEAGTVTGCKGPFSTNPTTKEAQALMIERDLVLKSAEKALDQEKLARPVGASDGVTGVTGVTEGILGMRQAFYIVLWALIIIASMSAPVPERRQG